MAMAMVMVMVIVIVMVMVMVMVLVMVIVMVMVMAMVIVDFDETYFTPAWITKGSSIAMPTSRITLPVRKWSKTPNLTKVLCPISLIAIVIVKML